MNCVWMLEVQRLKTRCIYAEEGNARGDPLWALDAISGRRVNSCRSQRDTSKTSSPLSAMINSVHLRRLSSIMKHKVPVLWPCIQGAVNYLVQDCQTDVIRLSFGLIIQWEVKAHNLGYLLWGQGHPWMRAGNRGHTTVPEPKKN